MVKFIFCQEFIAINLKPFHILKYIPIIEKIFLNSDFVNLHVELKVCFKNISLEYFS
jgi:hypothetical protein